jgi:hypothetical protein
MYSHYHLYLRFFVLMGVTLLWYFVVYPFTNSYVEQYQSCTQTFEKTYQTCQKIEQQCTQCHHENSCLETDYYMSIAKNRAACSHDQMLDTLLNTAEKSGMILTSLQLHEQKKDTWLHAYTITMQGNGSPESVRSFFHLISTQPYGAFPIDLKIERKDPSLLHITTTLQWIRCIKRC